MTLPPQLAALGAYNQWIVYKLVPGDKPGKTDKIPLDWRTGATVSAMDPANHADYASAAASPHGDGVGFVFTDHDPFWFLDVDGAFIDGQWSPIATELYQALRSAAWEVSQSGQGLHAFGSGTLPPHGTRNRALGLELYHKDRFVALTLRCYDGGDAGTAIPAIADVAARYFPLPIANVGNGWTCEPVPEWHGPTDDDALLAMAFAAKSPAAAFGGQTPKASLRELWEGETRGYGPSEADAALASHLAFWTGKDCKRIERLMRRSALARDKWDRNSAYLEPTIIKACAATSRVLEAPAKPAAVPVAPPPPVESEQRSWAITAEMAKDKGNHLTVEYWLAAQRVTVAYDEFADVIRINGAPITDHVERRLWLTVREQSGLKIPKDLFGETLRDVAWRNRHHPVRDWLADVQPTWDGQYRIDNWLTTHLGVAPAPYVSAVGALFLVAAVRRIREPGAKFDELLVLEGPQGILKSTAVSLLCPDQSWFTDNMTLGMSAKELLEVTAGKWIVEAPELSRMREADVEHVKALLSRQYDRARGAFDRYVTERGRQWVPFATTNDDAYLTDMENRRIWPVRVGEVNVLAIARDRTQLWAEAAQREASGASIRLAQELWGDAAEAQNARIIVDPLAEKIASLLGDMTGRVRGFHILEALHVPPEQMNRLKQRFGKIMKSLGWKNTTVKINGNVDRYFVKGDHAREIIIMGGQLKFNEPNLTAVT